MNDKFENTLRKEDTSSLFKHIIGGIIGGVIVTVPLTIIYIYGIIFNLFTYFIAPCTSLFYKKMGGKSDKRKIIIISVITLFMFILFQLVGIYGLNAFGLSGSHDLSKLASNENNILNVVKIILKDISLNKVALGAYVINSLANFIFCFWGLKSVIEETNNEICKEKKENID